jgi:hypothetical protein
MLKISKRFRSSYFSEGIVTDRVYQDGQWHNTVETVYNAVINNQISNQAVVFGNGLSRSRFDCNLIVNHLGGILGSKTLQTYGCNAIYRDYTVDFLVVPDRLIAKEIFESGYNKENIVYTRSVNMLEFPKQFYLIPNDPYADAGTTAVYIAAFDGHKKIFLLGFDGQDTPGFNNNIYANSFGYDKTNSNVLETIWRENLTQVFSVYDDVEFVIVSEAGKSPIPESWKYLTNVRRVSFREFVIEASL